MTNLLQDNVLLSIKDIITPSIIHQSTPMSSVDTVPTKIHTYDVRVFYGKHEALKGITLNIPAHHVTSLIGPSGCGKSTYLRCLNRMNDTIDTCQVKGKVELDGQDIYSPDIDVVEVRARVGMVFQKPNPFPQSIYDNIAYGPRLHGFVTHKSDLEAIVQNSLEQSGLWKEVKDRLRDSGLSLSIGQQQRLCIARALAIRPEVILMDEPCASLDPIATAHIEECIDKLRENFTIVIVTHNMQQAARVSQKTAFFHFGEVVEWNDTSEIFTTPQDERTKGYVTGRYG